MDDFHSWRVRFEWHLDQVPILLTTLRTMENPLKATRYDLDRVSGSVEESRAPMRVEAVDDADDLWAALVQYVANVAELLGVPTPSAVRASWSTRGEVAGLAPTVTGREVSFLAFDLIVWLIERADRVVELPLGESEAFLFGLIRKLRARYTMPVAERPARRRTCRVCGDRAVGMEWVDDGDRIAVLVAKCARCGAIVEEGVEGGSLADIRGSGGAGEAGPGDDQAVETRGDADDDGREGAAGRRGGDAPLMVPRPAHLGPGSSGADAAQLIA